MLLAEIAEEQGRLVDELTAEIEDPAAVVAFAHRHFVRLAAADPGFGQLAIRLDASHRLMHQALGPRAHRDIQAGIDSGRFAVEDVAAAVYITGGALLGYDFRRCRRRARPTTRTSSTLKRCCGCSVSAGARPRRSHSSR